jgi:peroxiredoxin
LIQIALLAAWFVFAEPARVSVVDTRGVVHTEAEWAGQRAIVIFFVFTDCPISNGYVPEMNRIAKDYAERGVRTYAVIADLDKSTAEIQKHAKEFEYDFPVLIDPKQQLVRLAGATVSPEAAVLSAQGNLLYLGRIDDRAPDIATRRTQIKERDLRLALDAVIAGRPVARARTTAVGCAISQPR